MSTVAVLSSSNYYVTSKGEIFEKATVRRDGSMRKARKIKHLPYVVEKKLLQEESLKYVNAVVENPVPDAQVELVQPAEEKIVIDVAWVDVGLSIEKEKLAEDLKDLGDQSSETKEKDDDWEDPWLDANFASPLNDDGGKLNVINEELDEGQSLDEYGAYWDEYDSECEFIEGELDLITCVKELESESKPDSPDSGYSSQDSLYCVDSNTVATPTSDEVERVESNTSYNPVFISPVRAASAFKSYVSCKEALSSKEASCWDNTEDALDVLSWGFQNVLVLN